MTSVRARASSAMAELWMRSGVRSRESRSAVGLPVGESGGGGLNFLSVLNQVYHLDSDAGAVSLTELEQAVQGNSATVSIRALGARHAVMVDDIRKGLVSIRDPWPVGKGSAYKISIDDFVNLFDNGNGTGRALTIPKTGN